MSRQLYEKISQEKLEAYLDGTLSEQETAEVDALVDSDKELQALVDEYFSIQIEIANSSEQTQGGSASAESINRMKQVIARVQKPSNSLKRDLRIMIGAACAIIAVIFGFMVAYTPLSVKSGDNYPMPMSRDGFAVFGEEVDYEAELSSIDSIIELKEAELPSVAFFDRYKSDEERKEIEKKRVEVYELQWNRMFILLQLQRDEELKDALTEYIEINGCHRDEAIGMLKELEERK